MAGGDFSCKKHKFSKLAEKKLNAGTGDVAAKVGDGKETDIKVLKEDLTDIHRFPGPHFINKYIEFQI